MLQLDQCLSKIINKKLAFWIVVYSFASFNKCATKEVYYDFKISYFDGAPDGVTVKILGVNNQFPGPTIRATKNDILTIKVTNQIQDHQPTTIHWHGLEQYLTPFVDGPRMITQCDIPFNSSFIYQFQVIQSGTYWYHSHLTMQSSEGLWGVLIIDNDPEVYNYDGEIVFAITPWYHIPGKDQLAWYKDMEKSQGNLPVPDSHLINGVGYYPCDYAQMKNLSCSPTNKDRYVMFEVERGKTYRLRSLQPAPLSGYHLSIDEHQFILIETDGVDTVMSHPLDEFGMSTGSRDSYLITMNGDKDQYWIRWRCAIPSLPSANISNLNPFPEFFLGQAEVLAVLKYKDPTVPFTVMKKSAINPGAVQGRPEMHDRQFLDDMKKNGSGEINFDLRNKFQVPLEINLASVDDPLNARFAYPPFPTTVRLPNSTVHNAYNTGRPIGNETAPNYVNQTIIVTVTNQDDPSFPNHRGGFNNITYDPSTLDKPALFKALLGENLPESVNPIKINGFGSDYVVEIIFNDFGTTGHPIHLHGHTFWVMGRGPRDDGPFVEEIHRPILVPVTRRETVSVLTQSWLVIRFRADNPGVWLLHCHILHHLEIAMGLVFEEGLEEARVIYKIPQQSVELCKRNGIDLDSHLPSNAFTIIVSNVLLVIGLFLSSRMLF